MYHQERRYLNLTIIAIVTKEKTQTVTKKEKNKSQIFGKSEIQI